MNKDETRDLSQVRPDKFSADIACGKCGELATLVYSTHGYWIVMHENLELDEDHEFYPKVS